MTSVINQKPSRQFSYWFWILLVYVIAALVWWFISLDTQNKEMGRLQTESISKDRSDYQVQLQVIRERQSRNTTKYISEGITFLVLILIGAAFVYRAIRKQMEYVSLQRNFMMAITHELKTPIATTRLSIETLLYRKLEDAQQKKLMHHALAETNRLDMLTNNILLSAQMEEKNYKPVREHLSLTGLVQSVVDDYRLRFPERTIDADLQSKISFSGDQLLLQLAVSNLVDNALKYTTKETPVKVLLQRRNDTVLIQVQDLGTGVSKSEQEKIFQKFYRGVDERTRKTKGTGLGLYLVKKIIESHEGTLSLKDNIPCGCNFVIQF